MLEGQIVILGGADVDLLEIAAEVEGESDIMLRERFGNGNVDAGGPDSRRTPLR